MNMIFFIAMQNLFMALRKNVSVTLMLILILATVLIGTLGFSHFEEDDKGDNVDLGTSFYWTITTVTTVGYGDISPATSGGRMVFYTVAFLGISTISFALGSNASVLVETSLRNMNGMGRTKMKGHIIIIGWNEVTEASYEELSSRGKSIVVIGDDDDAAEIRARGVEYIKGNPMENEALKRGNIENASVLLVPIESDEETILVALKAKKLNPDIFIVATCDHVENQSTMVHTGIDTVIPQSEIIGTLLGNAVTEGATVDFITELLKEKGEVDIESLEVVGEASASELLDPKTQKLIAFKKKGKTRIAFKEDVRLSPGDIIYYLENKET